MSSNSKSQKNPKETQSVPQAQSGYVQSQKQAPIDESNVPVDILKEDIPSFQSRAPTQRQLINARFKLENALRDIVLSLSDSLEAIEEKFKSEIIDKVKKVEPKLVPFLERPPISLSQNIPLTPSELYILENILKVDDQIYDHRLLHDELLLAVIKNQASERKREQYINSVLNVLRSSNTDPQGELINLNNELVRILNNLENDECQMLRKTLISHTVESIKEAKKVWSMNEHFAAEAWPIMDSINIYDTIVVQVYLGMNIDISELKLDVSKDGKKMVVSSVGPVPFKKQFLFPTEVKQETAKAVFAEGILRIKFQKAEA